MFGYQKGELLGKHFSMIVCNQEQRLRELFNRMNPGLGLGKVFWYNQGKYHG